jgi:hypothetical protein
MANEEVRINLTSSADTSGFDKISAASKEAGAGIGAASKESKAMSQELGRGVEIGNAAVSAFQNIANAGQGGASGLIAITRAGFSAGAMFKGLLASMGPFGIAAAAVGIAVGLISAALRKGEAAAKDAEARIAALNKVKLDEAAKEQDKPRIAAAEALKVLEAEARVKEEIADAELARRKAAVRADAKATGESAEVTEQKLVALDRQREDEKRANALKLAQERVSKLAAEEERRAKAAKEAADAYADQQKRLDTLAARERAAASTPETTSAMGMPTANPEYARAQADLAAARAAADGLSAESVAQQKTAAEALQKAAEEATRTANEARAAAELEAKKYRALTPIINDTRKAEDRAKAPQTEAEKAAIEKARAKQDEQIRRIPASIWANRMATEGMVDDSTAAAVQRNFPGYKFPTRPQASAPVAPLTPTSVAAAQPATPTPAPGGGTIQRGGETFRAGAGGLEKVADTLKGATEAVKGSDTGDATAKAAAELKAAEEQRAAAVQASAQQTTSAISDIISMSQETASVLGKHTSDIASLRAEIQSLRASVRAANRK